MHTLVGGKAYVFALVLIIFIVVSGCSSGFSTQAKSQASDVGVTGFSGWRGAGITVLTTASYVPGTIVANRPDVMAYDHSCDADKTSARVFYGNNTPAADATAACEMVLKAAMYVQETVPSNLTFRYELVLVPVGFSFETSRRSVSLKKPPVLRFAIPWFEDKRRATANMVDLIAHESVHAHVFAAALPRQDEDERSAYLMGLCAQLQVLGELGASDLPGAPLNGVEAAAKKSSSTAYEVRKEVYPYLMDGRIVANSPGGQKLTKTCSQAVRELFGPIEL